ncbi:MAG: type II secretion system protein J [Phycisphaerae bacterium]
MRRVTASVRGGRGVAVVRRARGLTLVELVIALSITSLIATAATTMLFATSRATEARQDLRHVMTRSAVVQARLADEIHRAAAFLAAGTDQLILWSSDANGNGSVNLAEIVLIERDSGTNELRRYAIVWPAGWSQATIDAANTTYAANTDFAAVVVSAKATGNFPATVWSSETTAMTAVLNNATAQDATLATLRLTLTSGDVAESMVAAASLRVHRKPS